MLVIFFKGRKNTGGKHNLQCTKN